MGEKDFINRYDNLPRKKQRVVRYEVMQALEYKCSTSFYALVGGRLKRLTVAQADAIEAALTKHETEK